MMRWDIINQLIKKHMYTSYLEIGYYKGWSLDNVIEFPETNHHVYKVAVDPNPCKDPEQERAPYGSHITGAKGGGESGAGGSIWKMTSDEFFKDLKEIVKYDLIFIDGLHEASQVTKDIQNSLKHLSPGGTIVLHDCNPPKYEHTTTGIDGCWTGDTYKAIIDFRDFYEGTYQFYCVDTDWGVGVIQELPYSERFDIMNPVSVGIAMSTGEKPWTWEFFDKHREELLNLISKQDFIRMIKDVKPKNERAKDIFGAT